MPRYAHQIMFSLKLWFEYFSAWEKDSCWRNTGVLLKFLDLANKLEQLPHS